MRTVTYAGRTAYILLLTLLGSLKGTAFAQARYSQIILTFPEERSFHYHYEPKDRALVLEFKGTSPKELESLFHYDERIVQRALFKDMAGQATEARLILRDENIKILVNTYDEPFRVSIDFFDPDYKEYIDPNSGLPLSSPSSDQDPAYESKAKELPDSIDLVENNRYQNATKPGSQTAAPKQDKISGKRRLLQVQPEAIKTAQDMVVKLNDINGGIGPAWKTYPPYIARIQTANLKSTKDNNEWLRKNAESALNSADAMAQYAGQLFDFGHESRALTLYQKLLHEEPSIFEKNAEAIWKLGEIHLGQGNFTLADGYYESLSEKHADHPLSAYAKMRRLDLRALRSLKEGKVDSFPQLYQEATKLPTKLSPGLSSQLALRAAYWGLDTEQLKETLKNSDMLPKIAQENKLRLQNTRSQAEGPKTAFLMDSIILHNRLADEVWNTDLSKDVSSYFDRYKGSATEPFRTNINQTSQNNFLQKVTELSKQKNYPAIVQLVEALPQSLNDLRKHPAVSWATAESLRELKQFAAAIPYYENAASSANSKIDQFRSNFILSQVSSQALAAEKGRNNTSKTNQLQNKFRRSDEKSWEIWQTLTPQEKSLVYAENKDDFEYLLNHPEISKTSPLVMLDVFSQKMSSEAPSSLSAVNAKDTNVLGTERMIPVFIQLSRKFEKLGLQKEQRQAKKLLSSIDVKNTKLDKETMRLWTDEVTKLAEEMRQENNFLEAGRLYTEAGSANNQWEGRAEALYKGGLLLYRAGRRDEAKSAFEQAASDGSNLLYADLAKERLEQLK